MVSARSGVVTAIPRSSQSIGNETAMRTPLGLRAGLWMLAVLASIGQAIFVQALAEDTPSELTGVARPSVEELAIPQPKPAEALRESETREAICVMVESAARAAGLPLEFFARVIWQES